LRFAQPEHSSPPRSQHFQSKFISLSLAIFLKRRAPCGTRRPLLTQQPTTTISRCSWKCYSQLLHAINFSGSEFLFSQDHLANSLPVTNGTVNVGQTARLPMVCAFWKIKRKETGCRLLLNCI
jgi:hypothetical protein